MHTAQILGNQATRTSQFEAPTRASASRFIAIQTGAPGYEDWAEARRNQWGADATILAPRNGHVIEDKDKIRAVARPRRCRGDGVLHVASGQAAVRRQKMSVPAG